jgi:trk system potassium uptake protein
VSDIHKDILKLVGADRVVSPEKEIAVRVADGISASFTDLVRINKQFSIIQLNPSKSFLGKKVQEIGFFSNYNVHCIGLKDTKDNVTVANPTHTIKSTDRLIFAGETADLEQLAKQ